MQQDPLARWEWEGGAVRSDDRSPPSPDSDEEVGAEPGSSDDEFAEPHERL
jgi:hypothetical protein